MILSCTALHLILYKSHLIFVLYFLYVDFINRRRQKMKIEWKIYMNEHEIALPKIDLERRNFTWNKYAQNLFFSSTLYVAEGYE